MMIMYKYSRLGKVFQELKVITRKIVNSWRDIYLGMMLVGVDVV